MLVWIVSYKNMVKKIKIIFLDCDGVLSTGSFFYTEDGKFLKEFSSMDGKGFSQAKKNGIHLLVISEEPHEKGVNITKRRCEDQKIDFAHAKNPEDKLLIAKKYADKKGVVLKECAFVADDIGDWFLFREVGLPVAVANAYNKLKIFAKENNGYITQLSGGRGAVREAIEWILEFNNKQKHESNNS
jgi:YrbI family 3-deoxy-D-manno-octulosonate 8-phosphate phosphatase